MPRCAYNRIIGETMSEILITVSQAKRQWITDELPHFCESLSVVGAAVSFSEANEIFAVDVTFDKSDKANVLTLLKAFFVNVYCTHVKRQYISEKLSSAGLPNEQRGALIRALTAFDVESDRRIVSGAIRLNKIFDVEGFYNFKLKGLRSSWDDLCALARENLSYASVNNGAYALLLRFLLSTVEPKSETVSVKKEADGYTIVADDGRLSSYRLSVSELFDALVDIAPVEILCDESVVDGRLISRLNGIFDIRRVNNLLYFCENKR